MSSLVPHRAAANVEWIDGIVRVTVGEESWSVSEDALDTVICLLEAGRTLVAREGLTSRSAERASQPVSSPVKTAAAVKRRSRKRVGDALIVWMEEHPGWHHEDALLQVVIDHKMTDASPLRALKIALGKQRDSIFSDGGHGYWKLASDETAGSLPQPPSSPTVRQRILAKAKTSDSPGDAEPMAVDAAAPTAGTGPRAERQSVARSERWSDVSNDEVVRARRNLLGLGSTS